MKKTLKQIMDEGWKEKLVFGFGRTAVVYEKGNENLIYDCEKDEIRIQPYLVREVRK